ncbi:MAG: tetratricopeptide repeat protein [Candidatus Xenobia bacterium]
MPKTPPPTLVQGTSLRQAYTLTEQGRFAEALQVLDGYVQGNAQDKRGWVLRAHVMLTMGNPQGAIDSIERVTDIDPADPMPWVIHGTALNDLGDLAGALHSLDNALHADPDNRDAQELRKLVLHRVVQLEQQHRANKAWYELAELHYRMGRHEDALPSLERALQLSSGDAANWGLKGCVLWALSRQSEALQAIGRAISLRGEDDWAYGVRATMLKELGRPEDALADVEEALQLNPTREDLLGLKRVLEAQIQSVLAAQKAILQRPPPAKVAAKARPSVRRTKSGKVPTLKGLPEVRPAPVDALPLEQPQPKALQGLRRAMEEAHQCYGRKQYREAAARYERIARQAPQDGDTHMAGLAWLYLARCHYALREFDKALPCYQEVARLSPDHPSWMEHGLTLRHLGQYPEASAMFERCIQAGHSVDAAWVQKGHCHLYQQQTEAGVEAYRRATEVNGRNAHAWFSLAQALAVLHRPHDALTALQQGLKLETANAAALELRGDVLTLLKQFDSARTSYEEALKLDPQRMRAAAAASALQRHSGQVPEVVHQRFGRAAPKAGAPASANGHAAPGVPDEPPELPAVKRAAAPRVPVSELLKRGRERHDGGEFAEGLEAFEQVLAGVQDQAEAWFGKALCLAGQWRFAEAGNAVDTAERLGYRGEDLPALKRRIEALRNFERQSVEPLLQKEARAWRTFIASGGEFRLSYPGWCSSWKVEAPGELARIGDRVEKPSFLFSVVRKPATEPESLGMVTLGEQLVESRSRGSLEIYEVRNRKKQIFVMRGVLLTDSVAWLLVGTARFHYYAGYRRLFGEMMEEFAPAP